MPNILAFHRVIGSYDLLATGVLDDFSSFIKMQREMQAIDGIDQVDFNIVEIWPSWPTNFFASLLE